MFKESEMKWKNSNPYSGYLENKEEKEKSSSDSLSKAPVSRDLLLTTNINISWYLSLLSLINKMSCLYFT